jgi:alginate O-acetyltransferase complex protein AlgI
MSFFSAPYFLFLPAVFLVFRYAGERHRWKVLLAASVAFYAALGAPYLLAALGWVAAVTYSAGIAIDRCEGQARKARFFWAGVGANLLALLFMKYLPFLAKNLNALLGSVSAGIALPALPILVSIGVSYYVFQAISYLIDIYLGMERPETHFGYLALYLAFFPKLLQGPIERAGDLLPQLRARYAFDYECARAGLLLFAWGLFKKVVVADRLGVYVDSVYGDVHAYKGLPLVLATYFYAGQLYYDFSGYTDMALGTARLFNIRLTQNFNRPYLATSIVEFWRRWHISFSRWILDYIFLPLQVRFRGWKTSGTVLALLLTFLACGIWHGASWTFVIWGMLHGLYMAVSVATEPVRKRVRGVFRPRPALGRALRTAFTFQLVCFAWIFFRSNTVDDALYVAGHLFSGLEGAGGRFLLAHGRTEIQIAIAAVLVAVVASLAGPDAIAGEAFRRKPAVLRWAAYYALVLSILWFAADDQTKFIYFRF